MKKSESKRSEQTLFNRLALVRTDRRVSRRELADAVGVHYQTIGYIERGEYSPSLEPGLKIAREMELPINAIFALHPFPRLNAAALATRPDDRESGSNQTQPAQ